jgi:hypothetical protein
MGPTQGAVNVLSNPEAGPGGWGTSASCHTWGPDVEGRQTMNISKTQVTESERTLWDFLRGHLVC